MAGRKRWDAPRSGPDWTDVLTLMKEIEKAHTCTCYLAMSPAGGGAVAGWQINVLAELPVLTRNLDAVVAGCTGLFPHRDHVTVEGLCYALLAKLDWELAQNHYGQEEMFRA